MPIETIAVTAAMPITTPSTVKLARILFLAKARKATRIVIHIDMRLIQEEVPSLVPSQSNRCTRFLETQFPGRIDPVPSRDATPRYLEFEQEMIDFDRFRDFSARFLSSSNKFRALWVARIPSIDLNYPVFLSFSGLCD